jgi:hypothetical protein
MAFTKNMPTAGQFQSVSQPIIRDNFNTSDDVMNTDHYGFSDPNHPGNHKIITSIDQESHPSAPTYPLIYATSQAGTNLGVLQYSKGPDRSSVNQISSPLTFIQSSETPIVINNGSTTDVFDFTGITNAFATLYMGNFSNGSGQYLNTAYILYVNPGKFKINNFITSGTGNLVAVVSSGNILKIQNLTGATRNNVAWTLQFLRIRA